MGIYSGTICYLIFSYLAIKISLSTEDSILNWHIMTDHIISRNGSKTAQTAHARRNKNRMVITGTSKITAMTIIITVIMNSVLIRRTTIKISLTVQTYRIREVNFPDQYLFNYN
jgi:hypothetical protein